MVKKNMAYRLTPCNKEVSAKEEIQRVYTGQEYCDDLSSDELGQELAREW